MKGRTIRRPQWEFLGESWDKHALCKPPSSLPWTGKRSVGDMRECDPSEEEQRVMSAICNSCPVMNLCMQYAVIGPNGRGEGGGFYAGVWIPFPADGHRHRTDKALKKLRELLEAT